MWPFAEGWRDSLDISRGCSKTIESLGPWGTTGVIGRVTSISCYLNRANFNNRYEAPSDNCLKRITFYPQAIRVINMYA